MRKRSGYADKRKGYAREREEDKEIKGRDMHEKEKRIRR